MENFINYYYNLKIKNIKFADNNYIISDGKFRYILKLYDNVEFLSYYDYLKPELLKYNYFFEIILNNNDNYISIINNKSYLLMKLSNIENDIISIFDIRLDMIIKYNSKLINLIRFPWYNLWENKIDYFERIFASKRDKYNDIYALFYYFIGLAENSVLYIKDCYNTENKEISDKMVISHTRISDKFKLFDYYDPSNIILDHPSRDVGEYIKSLFISGKIDLLLLEEYLNRNYFSRYGLRMLYSRIMFPSFFFDYIDDLLINDCEVDLLYLENRISEFQEFSRNISIFFKDKYDIPIIPWIIKKT